MRRIDGINYLRILQFLLDNKYGKLQNLHSAQLYNYNL